MIWALGLIAPFLVFVALIGLRAKAKRRPVQDQWELREHEQTAAPLEAPEPTIPTPQIPDETRSAFDELRASMDAVDANLCAPLLAALVCVNGVCRSFAVRMLCLT